jgi:hypothetical protein
MDGPVPLSIRAGQHDLNLLDIAMGQPPQLAELAPCVMPELFTGTGQLNKCSRTHGRQQRWSAA